MAERGDNRIVQLAAASVAAALEDRHEDRHVLLDEMGDDTVAALSLLCQDLTVRLGKMAQVPAPDVCRQVSAQWAAGVDAGGRKLGWSR